MKILLTPDPHTLTFPATSKSLMVWHPSYKPPDAGPECRLMEWGVFASAPRHNLRDTDQLILVGLNAVMTPGTRTEEVFEVLFNNTKEIPKISVDHTLFVSEPWRSWFHFGLVNAEYREYTYSYLAESHWRAYQDGLRPDDPFSLKEIKKWGKNIIRHTGPHYFQSFTSKTIPLSRDIHDAYQSEKEAAFEEEHTLGRILNRLSRFAVEACPTRSVPSPSYLFKKRSHTVTVTDLGIDTFLLRRLNYLVDLTSAVEDAHAG